jgi:fructosamine-3-kinase
MTLSGSLAEQVGQKLTHLLGTNVDVEQASGVGGGSINDAWRIDTNEGRFFLKTNNADRYPSMFEAEADGLDRLRSTSTLPVPAVLAYGEDHDTTWLLLEWIEPASPSRDHWRNFGQRLARLHRHTNDHFGLERDNYIGSLIQRNDPDRDWSSFFIHQRLEPMLKKARDKRKVEGGTALRFERLFSRLDALFPKEPPALLHGDLWKGNFLTGSDGEAWVVDPAVYYGHREMDIAMSRLFGGFEAEFYLAYDQEYPLEKGWQERIDLCNLYPLLVHVDLFGGSYVTQVDTILKRYV